MSDKRFSWDGDILFDSLELRELGNCLEARDIADLLNELYEENKQLKQKYHHLCDAILLSVSDLRNTEEVYLADFDILKRISEYEKELNEMTEKRFIVEYNVDQFIIYDNNGVDDYYHLGTDERDVKGICDLLNSLNKLEEENENLRKQVKSSETTSDATSNYNAFLESKITTLEKENEKLRKQMQNYEKLIANSYVGEEERLDGFVGRYVIWEDELQEYKNKNEMVDNE